MTKTKAKHISRTIYIIVATVLLTAIGTGMFFERYKLQTPILIQFRELVVKREVVINNEPKRSKEARRGEDEVEPAKADIQRITEFI